MAFHCIFRNALRNNLICSNAIKLASSRYNTFACTYTLTKNNSSSWDNECKLLVKKENCLVRPFSTAPKVFSESVATSHGHNHSGIWKAERMLSLSLLGVVPVAFIFPSQIMDSLLVLSVVMHNHWGVEAMVVDYVRPSVFGAVIPKLAIGGLYGFSIITLAGLFYFIFKDVGIVNSIYMIWKL